MNYFLMKWFFDEINSGKPIMYYNIETTGEEIQKRIRDALRIKEKSVLDNRTLKYCGYKIKNGKLVHSKYEPDPNKKER